MSGSPPSVLPSSDLRLGQQVSAPSVNKSFIIFLRESVTYPFTCMYREVFLNIYFNG